MKFPDQSSYLKNLLLLHLIVFIWGFTGILGKYITLSSTEIVWYRMAIAVISLVVYFYIAKSFIKVSPNQLLKYFGVGLLIAFHWVTFFEAIKLSNVSIALSCMATTTFFTALIEPFIFRRKIIGYELIMGVIVVLGIYLIFRFELHYAVAILVALTSAFLAALFTVLNARFVKNEDSGMITLYELMGGLFGVSIYMFFTGGYETVFSPLSLEDGIALLILGVVCTAFAFLASVEIMKTLTAFTVAISVNLEPIYAIILALLIFGESERMTAGFYLGAAVILLSIFINAYLKRTAWKRNLPRA
ncbi:MAG: DMT family transporter [Chitinophagales bacterium]|nr:DMT family transporter [Chitinophagales bacterium]